MGNKISIKEKFDNYITQTSKDTILSSLKEFLALKVTDDEIKFGILPATVRKYIDENADAVKITVSESINHVFYVANAEKPITAQDVIYLNNTLMLLARFIPVLNEPTYRELGAGLLWTKVHFPSDKIGDIKQSPSVLEDCLSIKLIYSLFKLMFLPEYTIATNKSQTPNKFNVSGLQVDLKQVWKNFDGTRNDNDQYKYYYNRTKVLECLLSTFSAPVPNSIQDRADPVILYCISPHNKLLANALWSFLCFGLSYEENGMLPYTQYLATDPTGHKLTVLSLQIFLLFIDVKINDEAVYHRLMNDIRFQQISEHFLKIRDNKLNIEQMEIENTETCKTIFQNTSETFLRELKVTEIYHFVSHHVLRVLRNPYDAENTYLMESRKKTTFLEEALLIFLRFIEFNPTYIQRLYYQKECLQIMVYLLYQIHENFTLAARSNIFYLAIILLSKLSCDRYFTVQLKKKFTNDIGFTKIPIFIGSHIDLLFIIFLNGMTDSYIKNYFCYQNNLLAILHNVAPFAKDLCPMTASLLIQLVKAVANPKTLKTDKNNMIVLRKTLNLIHKILCYQPETCNTLLYELLAQKKELEYLKRLPLKRIYGVGAKPGQPGANQSNASQVKSPAPKAEVENRILSDSMIQHRSNRDMEETKDAAQENKGEERPNTPPSNNSQAPAEPQMMLFDEKWMELFMQNINFDLIFVVTDYLQDQLRNVFREKDWNSEDEVKNFLTEQSILGIVPSPGPIMVEVVNDPINISTNLYIFLWQQIFLKSQGLPHFDAQDVRLINAS